MRSNFPRELVLSIFYYATPVFILTDYVLGFNVRISGLQQFGNYKIIYYVFCLVCAFVVYKSEGYSILVGFIESIINLVILFVGFLLPYFTYTSLLTDGSANELRFYDSKMIINFMISGFIFIFTFQNSLNRIADRFNL